MPIATPQGTLDFKSVDKVTFVGASSNTVIDTTTGSLGVGVGVGGPTSNLHVVGNTRLEGDINMIHTANTAAIKLNSNVVTEFPRSKKLIKYPRIILPRSAVGSTYNDYRIDRSSEHVTGSYLGVQDLFNNTATDSADTWGAGWQGSSGSYSTSTGEHSTYVTGGTTQGTAARLASNVPDGEWVSLQLPNAIQLNHVKIRSRNGADWKGQFPLDFEFWGSNNNGTTWSHIKSFSNMHAAGQATFSTFQVDSTKVYSRIALVVTKIIGAGGYTSSAGHAHFSISELHLYGTPEYDPEAHGTDVTIKSYPNVPNTDWLEVYYDAKDLTDMPSIVADLVGGDQNGAVTGATLDETGGINSFAFNGTSQYITASYSDLPNITDHTLAFWMKVDSTATANDYVVTLGVNDSGKMIAFNLSGGTASGKLHFDNWNSGVITEKDVYQIGQWVHVVGTMPGTATGNLKTQIIYVNGVKQSCLSAGAGTLTLSGRNELTIGARPNNAGSGTLTYTAFFDGSVANFRLFNRVLTSDEIYQLYAYQKEYFGHGDLSMTLKAGRLGIGTSEPRAALDVRGRIMREYNPGEIIETIQTRADGQNVRVLSGTYSIQNVTSLQDVTSSHTIVTGSSISYKPPPGTTRVIYEFYVYVRLKDPDVLIHFAGRLAGTQVSHTRSTFRSRDYEQQWVYNNMTITIGDVGSDNLANGKLASWTTNKTIDFTCRDYDSGLEGYLHGPEHWDGGGTSIKITPFIKITAIA
jgi:hypothetical protein